MIDVTGFVSPFYATKHPILLSHLGKNTILTWIEMVLIISLKKQLGLMGIQDNWMNFYWILTLLVNSPSVWFRHKALPIFGTREARQLLGEAGFSEERKDCFFSSRNNSWQLHRRIASASGGLHGSSSNARLTCFLSFISARVCC